MDKPSFDGLSNRRFGDPIDVTAELSVSVILYSWTRAVMRSRRE
jgi:hypothetical protein